MYFTGLDPLTMQPVYVPKTAEEKAMQRALIQYRDPKNRSLVEQALRLAKRTDLIGFRSKMLDQTVWGKPKIPDGKSVRKCGCSYVREPRRLFDWRTHLDSLHRTTLKSRLLRSRRKLEAFGDTTSFAPAGYMWLVAKVSTSNCSQGCQHPTRTSQLYFDGISTDWRAGVLLDRRSARTATATKSSRQGTTGGHSPIKPTAKTNPSSSKHLMRRRKQIALSQGARQRVV
ncbi:MAG: DUF3362 domain-containing protein [Bacillus subtilis]|nr:DUF3362 domain-containing protein [Bacillus subtilis]